VSKSPRKIFWNIAKYALAVGVLVMLAKSGRLDLAKITAHSENWLYLVLGFAASFMAVICTILRWQELLIGQGIQAGTREVFSISLVSGFFNVFIPGSVGGDVLKAVYIAKGRTRKAQAVTTVFLDRIFGLACLILFALCAVLVDSDFIRTQPSLFAGVVFLAVLFGCFVVCLALLFAQVGWLETWLLKLPFGQTILKIYEAIALYRHKKWILVKVCLFSFLSQGWFAFAFVCFGSFLQSESLPLVRYLVLVPMGMCINAIPVFPGGWGIGELGFEKLFAFAGNTAGAEMGVLFHLSTLPVALIGLLIFLMSSDTFKKTGE